MNDLLNRKIVDYLGHTPDFDDVIFYVSKKNSVARYKDIIFKFFCWGDYRKEKEIYETCLKQNISTPEMLFISKDFMVLRYIEEKKISFDEKVELVLDWLISFHKKTGYSKGDQRLHNYLFDGKKILGIDFEESFKGDFDKDYASLFTTLCGKIEKSQVERLFISKKINIDSRLFIKTYSEEIEKRKKYV